jgi:hypothetical protein
MFVGKSVELVECRENSNRTTKALTMTRVLVKAHQQIDNAVDLCYWSAAFPTELNRLEYLSEEYRHLTAPVLVDKKTSRKASPKKVEV